METDEERRIRRQRRIEQMKREKRKAEIINRLVPAAGLAVLIAVVFCVIFVMRGHGETPGDVQAGIEPTAAPSDDVPSAPQTLGKAKNASAPSAPEPTVEPKALFAAHSTSVTQGFGEEIVSQYGVFIDVEEETILAQRDAFERMNPASMTKILTVLVAAEHISEEQLSDTASITIDITDYCYINECSVTGYSLNETVPIKDLFYGTVLPSGADAALALAKYVAGSHEAFVELMNEKLEEMGLSETTHFTNCIGLYDEEHYSTAYDMALILKAAVDNDFLREVLSAHTYSTAQTEEHPEGLLISNWFLRRIEDRDTHGEVLCAKTGYVVKSGNCAASLGVDYNGKEYICVTAASRGNEQCIADQVALYQKLLPEVGNAAGGNNN